LSRAQIAAALRRAHRRGVEAKATNLQQRLRTAQLRQPTAVQAAYAAIVTAQVRLMDLWPRPGRIFAAARSHSFRQLAAAIDLAFARWDLAVDKQPRGAVIDFAGDSHHANPRAADLYQRARVRRHEHPHAVRVLARAWLHIIWRCWQDHALSPRQTPRPPDPSPAEGLTQGYSCRRPRVA
jgi:hypothetical protein